MSTTEPKPTLAIFMALGPTQQIVKTRFFGGRYVTAAAFFGLCAHLYENSALLGRALRSRLVVLEQMLGEPKRPGVLIQQLQRMAKERRTAFHGVPSSFFSFVVETELQKAGLSLSPPHPKVLKGLSKKMSLEDVNLPVQFSVLEGIAFGAEYPDLTERMYRNFHENIDRRTWDEARNAGLSLPDAPPMIRLEEQEQTVVEMVGAYASEHHPELIDRLGLPNR